LSDVRDLVLKYARALKEPTEELHGFSAEFSGHHIEASGLTYMFVRKTKPNATSSFLSTDIGEEHSDQSFSPSNLLNDDASFSVAISDLPVDGPETVNPSQTVITTPDCGVSRNTDNESQEILVEFSAAMKPPSKTSQFPCDATDLQGAKIFVRCPRCSRLLPVLYRSVKRYHIFAECNDCRLDFEKHKLTSRSNIQFVKLIQYEKPPGLSVFEKQPILPNPLPYNRKRPPRTPSESSCSNKRIESGGEYELKHRQKKPQTKPKRGRR
jgi:hypothetical protein